MFPFKAIVVGVFCVYISKIERATSSPAEFPGKRQRGGDPEQDGWTSVLSSIESRLENLDSLYTSQLTPTIKTRLEHFQNRISGMELKLLRIEALLTTKLDRMSDNISSRHFRDDMAQTDLFRKIETAYDGITHRLAYMDRKSENSFLKIQGKTEIISKKLEDMDDTYTLKYDLLESELSDYGTGIDDLRTIFNISEQKLFNSFEKHTQDHLLKLKEMQLLSKKNISQELADTVHKIQENTTKSFDYLRRKMNTQISMSNSTGKTMQKFSEDLGRTLNEYASKVADLGAQVLKSDNKISTHLRIIETVSNSTRVELQNGLRALMVQVGKVSNNEDSQYEVVDQKLLSDMSQKLETNFGKIIDTQNSFLESCHRVQMDESQMETQISHILNKLIDNFSDTTKEQHYLQKKMENLLIKHDVQFKKEMYQANTNILATFDHTKKNFKVMNEKLKKSEENLEALFSLMQNVVGGSPVNWKRGNVNEKGLREHIQKLEDALNFTKIEQLAMFDSYRATIETLLTMTESRNNEEKNMHLLMKNITGNILNVKEKLQNLSMDLNTNDTRDIIKSVENVYKLVKENNDNLVRVLKSYENGTKASENKPKGRSVKVEKPKDNRNITNNENAGNQSDIDELIRKVFFINTTTTTEKTEVSCLDFDIDVRFESGTRYEKCGNQSKKPESIVESAETGNPDRSDDDTGVDGKKYETVKMEPMTLGSAPSSPSTPSTNPNFLPGFLMGDAQPTTALSTSPGRNRNTSATFNKLGMNTPEQKNLRQKLFNPPQIESTFQSPFVPLSEKGGPPKHGLFDSIDNKRITSPGSPILSSTIAPYCENAAFNESISRINDDSFNGSINMNMLNESARINSTLNRLERIDSNWITVFGFPPSAMSLVLAQLSNCGTIVEKLLPSQGNWVHLKFSNSNEVSRALTLNGKCISNSIMIGVHLYHNKENKENNGSNAMIYSSPVRARSLRQSFTSPQTINNSVVISQNVPQKSTGIVNKAIEYVFGW